MGTTSAGALAHWRRLMRRKGVVRAQQALSGPELRHGLGRSDVLGAGRSRKGLSLIALRRGLRRLAAAVGRPAKHRRARALAEECVRAVHRAWQLITHQR